MSCRIFVVVHTHFVHISQNPAHYSLLWGLGLAVIYRILTNFDEIPRQITNKMTGKVSIGIHLTLVETPKAGPLRHAAGAAPLERHMIETARKKRPSRQVSVSLVVAVKLLPELRMIRPKAGHLIHVAANVPRVVAIQLTATLKSLRPVYVHACYSWRFYACLLRAWHGCW